MKTARRAASRIQVRGTYRGWAFKGSRPQFSFSFNCAGDSQHQQRKGGQHISPTQKHSSKCEKPQLGQESACLPEEGGSASASQREDGCPGRWHKLPLPFIIIMLVKKKITQIANNLQGILVPESKLSNSRLKTAGGMLQRQSL